MTDSTHAEALRRAYPAVLAALLARTRSLADAEDAVQDALERALKSWPDAGTPDSAEAWLITVAMNAHRDRARRANKIESSGVALERLAELSPWARIAVSDPEILRSWKDELLRLLFACCHPALEEGESAALTLATVVGLSTPEIAHAFVVAPRTMEQRLTRARQRLRERGEADDSSPERARDRLGSVLRVIHLLFNEGYWSSSEDAPIRSDLCRLALGLCRSLHEAMPTEAEIIGVLALMMLHDARRSARLNERGEPVPLPEQDRSRWDTDAIASATQLLDDALANGTTGPFQIEAAISAVHCRAKSANETDWHEISALYLLLERIRPTPAVRVNRAYAVSRTQGPAAALALLDERAIIDAEQYPYVHLVRGTLLVELDRRVEARDALLRAEALARNAAERSQIRRQIELLTEPNAERT